METFVHILKKVDIKNIIVFYIIIIIWLHSLVGEKN